jgi:hypothetical protein
MQQAFPGIVRGHAAVASWSHRYPRRYKRQQHGGAPRVHVSRRGPRVPGVAELVPQGRRVPPGKPASRETVLLGAAGLQLLPGEKMKICPSVSACRRQREVEREEGK